MKPTIHPAKTSDFDILIAVSARTIRASYSTFLGAETVENWMECGTIETYFRENLSRCLVLRENKAIRGFAVAKDNLIDLLMIDHDHQRRGLGRLLLAHLEAKLFAIHPRLRLECFEQNDAANDFYKSQGWVAGKSFIDSETGIAMVTLEKSRSVAD